MVTKITLVLWSLVGIALTAGITIFFAQLLSSTAMPKSSTVNNLTNSSFPESDESSLDSTLRTIDRDYKLVAKWGKVRSYDGLLSFPEALAVDDESNVYVAGGNYGRIQKFSSNGTFLIKWGTDGSKEGELNFPTGLTVSKDGHVYVADSQNNRIQKFTDDGKFVSAWDSYNSMQLSYPSSISVDKFGNVYVFDVGSSSIMKFDSAGRDIKKWGSFCTLFGYTIGSQFPVTIPAGKGCIDPDGVLGSESGDGQFMDGVQIAVDPEGYFYALDRGNNRTQKFTADGKLVAIFDYHGSAITVDSDANVYVADFNSGIIRKLSDDGSLLAEISSAPSRAITVDKYQSIYLLSDNHVLKFSRAY